MSAAPYKPTIKEIKRIMNNRLRGIYKPDDVFNEAWLSLNDMKTTDACFTLQHSTGRFFILSLRELLTQIKIWRSVGAVCLADNICEQKFGDKVAWSFVIQPADEDEGTICPLSLALNTMVSGFTYVAKDKSTADLVFRALNNK
jgi:hypothetical protein